MRVHTIKIARRYYERLVIGQKTFEVRRNDRDYQVGDLLNFDVVNDVNSNTPEPLPEGGWEKAKVTYTHQGYGLDEDFIILGVKMLDPRPIYPTGSVE
jgi:hypothetical protein